MRDLYEVIGHHLPGLEERWAKLSENPKHVNEWKPAELTECKALADLVPLLRSQQPEYLRRKG